MSFLRVLRVVYISDAIASGTLGAVESHAHIDQRPTPNVSLYGPQRVFCRRSLPTEHTRGMY